MARHRPRLAAGALVALLALGSGALVAAQTLARLSVGAMTLSADPQRLAVGDTLHLVIRAHVGQRIAQLDNVNLPNLSGFDVLGDERRCVPAANGTDCTESLTISPNVAGTHAIGPVTLDAIDARTNRPTHFATNGVTIVATTQGTEPAPSLLYVTMRQILTLALAAMVVLVVIWGAGLSRRRAARVRPNRPPEPSPPPPPVVDPDAGLRRAVEQLRVEPTRRRAEAVRAMLRERAGARRDETLSDIVARMRDDARLTAALIAVERPAFVEEDRVAAAVSESDPALAALLTHASAAVSLEGAMPVNVTWQPVADAQTPKGDLPATAFAFPRERKEPLIDAGHVRSALARFNQVEGVSDDERAQAFANIRAAAEHYGVHVSETSWRDFFTS